MTYITKKICAAVLAFGTVAGTASAATAASPNTPGAAIVKINGEGFRICKAFGNSGYTAMVHGQVQGVSTRSGSRSFRVRTCFENKAQCDRFLARIHHKIGGIDRLYRTKCKSRA